MISETKLDETFPVAQFLLQGFCMPYRFNRNGNGGSIMLYIREDITFATYKGSKKKKKRFEITLNTFSLKSI